MRTLAIARWRPSDTNSLAQRGDTPYSCTEDECEVESKSTPALWHYARVGRLRQRRELGSTIGQHRELGDIGVIEVRRPR